MRRRNRYASAGALVGLACCIALAAGCGGMSQPREWGPCAGVGALVGAGAGAASGIVIVAHTHGHGESQNDTRVYAGVGGAVVGAGLGALIGHFSCDPIKPPPPPPQMVEAAPPPPPPPPPPAPAPREIIVLRGVHFDFNKSDIRPEDEPVLDEAAATLQSHQNMTIDVNGYCDWIGSDAYNLKLSDWRAAAVAQYLEGKGISASRLVSHGFGKTNFVATNDTDEGRAQNRRVELVPR